MITVKTEILKTVEIERTGELMAVAHCGKSHMCDVWREKCGVAWVRIDNDWWQVADSGKIRHTITKR